MKSLSKWFSIYLIKTNLCYLDSLINDKIYNIVFIKFKEIKLNDKMIINFGKENFLLLL